MWRKNSLWLSKIDKWGDANNFWGQRYSWKVKIFPTFFKCQIKKLTLERNLSRSSFNFFIFLALFSNFKSIKNEFNLGSRIKTWSTDVYFSFCHRKFLVTDPHFGIFRPRTWLRLRGESKFEISTLSVNPTLRGWGVNPLTLRITVVFFVKNWWCRIDAKAWGVGGQTLASDWR